MEDKAACSLQDRFGQGRMQYGMAISYKAKKMVRTTIGIMLGASTILKQCNVEIPEELKRYER